LVEIREFNSRTFNIRQNSFLFFTSRITETFNIRKYITNLTTLLKFVFAYPW